MTVEVAKKKLPKIVFIMSETEVGCRLCEKVKCHVLATEHITSPSVVAFQTFLFYQISKKVFAYFRLIKLVIKMVIEKIILHQKGHTYMYKVLEPPINEH